MNESQLAEDWIETASGSLFLFRAKLLFFFFSILHPRERMDKEIEKWTAVYKWAREGKWECN